MIADKKMKIGLIVQSFAPLFLILLVKNFDSRLIELVYGLFHNRKLGIESSLLMNLIRKTAEMHITQCRAHSFPRWLQKRLN